jgi:hypothetical protein
MTLAQLAKELREYEGVTRKHGISSIVRSLPIRSGKILASFGEDAAVIDAGDEVLLLAADGIWDVLMRANEKWAGYCAVLVNLHDIAAMGGTPIAMVDVCSLRSKRSCSLVSSGMKEAVEKFGVPIVGGHIHPGTSYDAIDIAILGKAKRDAVVYSHTAKVEDDIVAAFDLLGKYYPKNLNGWDSTRLRSGKILRMQLDAMGALGESKLVNSGKDISNPGIIGTLGMLLEVSGKGAMVDVRAIPKPRGVELERWLKTYPGMGFVVTCSATNTKKVISVFERHLLTAAKVGVVTKKRVLRITDGRDEVTVFDFGKEGVTGLKPRAR